MFIFVPFTWAKNVTIAPNAARNSQTVRISPVTIASIVARNHLYAKFAGMRDVWPDLCFSDFEFHSFSGPDSISLRHSYDIQSSTTQERNDCADIFPLGYFFEFDDLFLYSSKKTPSTSVEPPTAEPPTSTKDLPIDSDIGYHDNTIDCQSIDPFSTYIKVPDSSSLW